MRDRGFDITDLLPFVSVPRGETPIVLERLEIAVVVSGMFAETTQTLTFRNPNRRPLEGSLTFPLPDGAVVCGYAIDLDGELVDGVVVAKQEARRILETEIRKGADPGLVEQVQGNVYRARIYPLPAAGIRTVRIAYVSDLACDGTSAAYHLPLAHAAKLDHVSLRVEIVKGEVIPQLSGGLGNLALADLRDAFVAEATLPRGTACDDLLVKLPDLPRHLRVVERCGDDALFAVSSAIPASDSTWTPQRIALLWDASGSRTEIDRELELVSALLDRWPRLAIDVCVVRDVVDREPRSFAGREARAALLDHLRDLPRDGGTNLTAFDPTALPHPDDEAWLVLSDGLNTIGRGLPARGTVPIVTCTSAARSDSSYLRQLAAGGGIHVDLGTTTAVAAVELVATARDGLRVIGTEGCEDVHVRRAAGRLSIVGHLTGEVGQVRVAGSGAPADHISISRSRAVAGHLVGRAWAGQHAGALAVIDPADPRILELARRFGVVTANASLLVLETLAQHVEHDVEPAASRTAMRAEFARLRTDRRRDESATKSSHLERVVELWRERVRWWETVFEPRQPEVVSKKTASPMRAGAPGAVAMAMASPDEDDLAMSVGGAPSAPMEMSMEMEMAMPAPAASAGRGGPGAPGGPPRASQAPEAPRSPAATIQIKAWSADTPYLTALRASPDPHAAYLSARAEYAASPAFFLDCGDFFLGTGARTIGLRVLSNLLELGLDDPALMRMYAWRLQQAGELDAAIDVFERVRGMRDDEPQSHRDLGLALGERWEKTGAPGDATRAMELLHDVVDRMWERFPEIELIALMELNRLIARTRERGIATPARIDPRLIRLLDLDLRISMSWDLDLTDVDLHVFEPNGEHAYYGQRESSGGGLVSRDFREGYGPEEYVRHRAAAGRYTVKAHYYGSHQQDVAGACTVIVHVMVNFGRPNEQRQVMTLRLDRPSDQVVVGDVTFEPSAPVPVDWRPRFKKLAKGMTLDEVASLVGQPRRIEGADETVLVFEPGPGIIVHVVAKPRVIRVVQIMAGAALDLI